MQNCAYFIRKFTKLTILAWKGDMNCYWLWSEWLSLQCCCCWVASVVSDSVRPHRWQPTRLPRPWDSPGRNTGVGCHLLLQCMEVKSEKVAQSCPTLSDPLVGLQPTRLLRPWDFPGKSTGVGCHCLLRSLHRSYQKKSLNSGRQGFCNQCVERVRHKTFIWPWNCILNSPATS